MLMSVLLSLGVTAAGAKSPPKPTPSTAQEPKAAPVEAPPPPVVDAPAPTPPPVAAIAPTDVPSTSAPEAPPPVTSSLVKEAWRFTFELGVDVPGQQRFPMASTRLELDRSLPMPTGLFASAGLRSGYSYVAGKGAVSDPVLGVDGAAYVMAHRIPVRVAGTFGLHGAPAPIGEGFDVGVIASGGLDVAIVQAQSFGRAATSTAWMPAVSLGAFASCAMSDALDVGLLGEWDAAETDVAATTPGVSGDLSAFRLALLISTSFG